MSATARGGGLRAVALLLLLSALAFFLMVRAHHLAGPAQWGESWSGIAPEFFAIGLGATALWWFSANWSHLGVRYAAQLVSWTIAVGNVGIAAAIWLFARPVELNTDTAGHVAPAILVYLLLFVVAPVVGFAGFTIGSYRARRTSR